MKTTNRIQEFRKKRGLSQLRLSEAAGLSLRTIQRLEKDPTSGSPHSLSSIAEVLAVRVEELLPMEKMESDPFPLAVLQALKVMNLSALSVLFLPFCNLIFPSWIFWNTKNEKDFILPGRKILSFQIIWTLGTVIAIFGLPPLILLAYNFHRAGGVPWAIPIYYLSLVVHIFYTIRIARALANGDTSLHFLPNIL
ncbi:MAG: helix-turn-helix domain-containing protein [Bacteroidota bacterium]